MDVVDFNAAMEPEPQTPEVLSPAPPPALYDTGVIKGQLAVYDQEIDRMVRASQSLAIIDDVSNGQAAELAATAKKLFNQVEKIRKDYTQPALDFQRSVNNLAKGYQDRLGAIERDLKAKAVIYQARVELERRKAQEIAQRAAEELQKKVEAEAKAANVEPPAMVAPVIAPAPRITRTEAGTMSFRENWKSEVIDEAKVPRQYLMVNESAIRQAVNAGLREIPGVRIWAEKEAVIRT